MDQAGHAGRLVRGGELLAGLVVTGGDFPWLNTAASARRCASRRRTVSQYLSSFFTSTVRKHGGDGAMNRSRKRKTNPDGPLPRVTGLQVSRQ